MLIVSYYTPDYADCAARLRRSTDRHGLFAMIRARTDRGAWLANCAAKPLVVFDAWSAWNGNVLWVDADAEVLRPLDDMIPEGTDFAIHRKEEGAEKLKFSSGTVYFGRKGGAINLLQRWVNIQEQHPDKWDQETLYMAWSEMQDDLVTHWLPITYCQRFDERKDVGVPDPHIVHYQESRNRRKRDRCRV